jgi:hypothetical protein
MQRAPAGRRLVTFTRSRQLFLRLLGAVYLIAFASLAAQMSGLAGSRGILPVAELLPQMRETLGADAYRAFPTLLWLWSGDTALALLSWGGALLSLVLIAGVAPVPTAALLWLFYLSLTVAGQAFLEFQWDSLLLETGLLACLCAPLRSAAEPNPIVRCVLWSLAFKLTFLSGITKLLSGDPTWASWTALTYHYQTQPLPSWTSWYAYQLPAAFHYWSVAVMLAIELVAPFAIFLPPRRRRIRLAACVLMIGLQVGIGATGNYGFFNLLTIVLYLALLDDRTLRWRAVPPAEDERARPREPPAWRTAAGVVALLIAFLSAVAFIREMQVTAGTRAQIAQAWPGRLLAWLSPFRAINGYGLFRVMTTARPELILEVSENEREFEEWEFRWKPGVPHRRPAFAGPHMPRLDWQMWFAALDPPRAQYWLDSLARRIVDDEPAVVRLLGPRPVAGRVRIVRFASYDYRFTTPAERARNGAWWSRTFTGRLN